MASSKDNEHGLYFSTDGVDFEDDESIRAFAWRVWHSAVEQWTGEHVTADTTDPSAGTSDQDMTVVPFEEWSTHPWLSQLQGGSDTELDPAWFYTVASAPAPLAALDRIIVQESGNDGPWELSIRADGAFFPSRGNAEAAVGWFQRIWAFMNKDVTWKYRALVPSWWDCVTVPREGDETVVGYFTDWRIRTWTCACGWTGTNQSALVFANNYVVSIACPHCAHGLALIDRHPSPGEIATAAALGNAEALTIQDPGAHANEYVDNPNVRGFVTGHENEVTFTNRDQFFGVPEEWLRRRLRLDKRVQEFDFMESFGLMIALDNELIENLDLETVLGGPSRELCSYGDGGIVSGRTDIVGEWLEDWAPEVRHRITWMGSDTKPDRELALAKIVEGMDSWWPQEGDLFEVTSPLLDALRQEDINAVLGLAGDADEVTLNGVLLRP